MSASDYLENKLLDHVLGTAAYSQPTPYVALFTSGTGLETNAPIDEVTGTGYSRQTVSFNAASSGTATSNGAVQFTATASWGTVTHMAIMDASSGGNVLYWSALASSKVVDASATFQFNDTTIQISLD
jgi:hypothetical protein